MARKKDTPIGEESRDELRNFNDRRFKNPLEGVAAKEERTIEKFFEKVRENTLFPEDDE